MAIFYWDVKQGTEEWFSLRSGIPTASEFDKILTPKQMKLSEQRHKYAVRLIAESILNWQAESLDKIKHIEEGKKDEPFAVAQLEAIKEIETRSVGFVSTKDKRFGASPDRVAMADPKRLVTALTSVDITIECKAPTIPTQMEYLLLGHDDAYRCQVQGQIWVAESDKAIFYSYNKRTPAYEVETGRDEPFLAKLKPALEQFSDEFEALKERALSLGMYQPFPKIATPAEAEYGPEISAGAPPDPVADAEAVVRQVAAVIEGPLMDKSSKEDGGLLWG